MLKYRRWILLVVLLLGLFPAALAPVIAQEGTTLTVVTHDSFNVSEDVLATFEEETGITIQILRSGDTGTMVNQSVLSKNNPLGDVMYGVDNTFLTRALDADLFIPYGSDLLEDVSEDFLLDDEGRVTPVDYGDVCLNYDVAYFEDAGLDLPQSFEDLLLPEYNGQLVVENPAISSPGLAFLLATIDYFGTPEDEDNDYTYLDYWADLAANDALVVDDWTDAYYGEFSASSEGTRPLVVSYASSPPAEVYFAEEPPDDAPTGSITTDGMCFRQIEFVGILDGTENLEAAQQFVDFMLSQSFQEDMPLQMFVFPVNEQAELPDVFAEYAAIPENPVTFDIAAIDTYRERWIQAWTDVVLR